MKIVIREGSYRALRGGSCLADTDYSRVSYYFDVNSDFRFNYNGFRIARRNK